MAAEQPHDDGIDIMKFFLGVMALLTVFVAGFAAYNWSKAQALEEEVEEAELSYDRIRKIAGDPKFLEQVARLQTMGGGPKGGAGDFGRFLQDTAQELSLTLVRFRSVGTGGTPQKGFSKQAYEFSIERQPLDVIVAYLWYIQAVWPGLKIEELSIKEASRRNRDEPFPGWDATATAAIFKPKEG